MGLGWGVGGNKKTRGIYLPTYLPTVGLGCQRWWWEKKRVLCGSRPVPVSFNIFNSMYVGSRTT